MPKEFQIFHSHRSFVVFATIQTIDFYHFKCFQGLQKLRAAWTKDQPKHVINAQKRPNTMQLKDFLQN